MSPAYSSDDQDGGALSKEDLAMLRDACATEDMNEVEKAIMQIMARPVGIWPKFRQWLDLHDAICSNYDKIISIANDIINSPNSSAADKQWARGKRDEAIAGKERQGCSPTVLA